MHAFTLLHGVRFEPRFEELFSIFIVSKRQLRLDWSSEYSSSKNYSELL